MSKRNGKEPIRLFKYAPGIVLSLGAAVVAAAAILDKPVVEPERTAVTYPAPVEVAEAPTTEIVVQTPDPEPTNEEPKTEIPVVVTPETIPSTSASSEEKSESVPEVKEEPKGVPSPIDWPVVKEEPKVELPIKKPEIVVVETEPSSIVVEKPKKKACKKTKKDESVKDVFTENFMRGNGF